MGYSVTVSLFSLGRVFVLQAAGEAPLFNLVKRIILKVKVFNSTVGLHCGVVNVCACKRLWMCVCLCVNVTICPCTFIQCLGSKETASGEVALLSYYSY